MRFIIFSIVGLLFFQVSLHPEDLPSHVKTYVKEAISIRQKAQKEEDQWFKEKQRLEAKYKALKEENMLISNEIARLKKEIALHKDSIEKIHGDISKIEGIKARIEPFILSTYNRLRDFIKQDIPFLPRERGDRIKRLEKVLYDPTISISERFRRLMEAIFIEAEYANTIEVYQDRIRVSNDLIYANILRIGRVCLFFQSLDGKISGYFNPASGWELLPKRYNKDIDIAMEIAEKRRPAEIIDLPIGRIKR